MQLFRQASAIDFDELIRPFSAHDPQSSRAAPKLAALLDRLVPDFDQVIEELGCQLVARAPWTTGLADSVTGLEEVGGHHRGATAGGWSKMRGETLAANARTTNAPGG